MITINYLRDRGEGVLLCYIKVTEKRAQHGELRARVSSGGPRAS